MTNDSIVIQLEGGIPLYERKPRAAILDALASSPFAVERYTFADESMSRFDRREVLRPLRSSGRTLFLERNSPPACSTSLSLSDRVSFFFRVEAQALKGIARDAVLELADRVAAAMEPDMGWVHVHRPLDPPFDEAARARRLLDEGTFGGPFFRDKGPGGFGMRTYFGPRALHVLPARLLLELPPPAVVAPTPWRGMRVDLCAHPLDSDDATVLAAAASAHRAIAPAEFFREPISTTGLSFEYEPAPWWSREALGLARIPERTASRRASSTSSARSTPKRRASNKDVSSK